MSPAHVLEPTYAGLKYRLMTGAWPLGLRLDAARLADDLGVSVTPVRDCLNRLVGEHLVDFQAGEGYRVANLSERTLRDLYAFTADLLELALTGLTRTGTMPGRWAEAADYPERVTTLFEAIAHGAGNSLLTETVKGLGERLHAARICEARLLDGVDAEIADIAEQFAARRKALSESLAQYHCRRRKIVPGIIEMLEQAPI